MSEDNKKDNGKKAADTLKDRPDKKHDLHDYKSEDKYELVGAPKEEGEQLQETEDEKELQDEQSLKHITMNLYPQARGRNSHIAIMASSIFQCLKILNSINGSLLYLK